MKENILYGLLGGLIGSLYMGWVCSPKIPQLAVVDMQLLISRRSQQLAKAVVSGALVRKTLVPETLVPKARASSASAPPMPAPSIREAGDRLKEGLKAFAIAHNFILLPKGTVIGGDLPDKTEEILALIEKGDFS